MQSYVEAWKFFSPEERAREEKEKEKSFLFELRDYISCH